ncbi:MULTISPECIES: chromate transporter [unclassified Polynucleobacter]|uniref:chromate transporter n=1 Tax=unclassified Polynucleobacter TaxID=2640945 RepID=UPI001BFD2407|nr:MULTISPECIES: chromate transporter [unclassified Polynucleobacter]MBU3632586.1 chromate transporter [Polynucleobacter sp. AP-Feld-500C-C5]QWD69926.1 chromate transporter [Polynucleobacter sp. UB-Siik-W21]QWE06118.1 chromate transporter [Polynucleobacter sp. JS-JIR-5-A7]
MKTLTPLELFISFSKIGMSGFGGVLPWARRTLVERDKILTSEEFSAILGICQIVPGPNIVNLAVCIGSRFGGARGAIAAVLGLTLGPISIVMVLALLYEHYRYLDSVQGVLRGISAVGVGLIASTGFKMLKDEFRYPAMLIVVIVTILAASYFHLGLGWVVLISSPLALVLAWKKAHSE